MLMRIEAGQLALHNRVVATASPRDARDTVMSQITRIVNEGRSPYKEIFSGEVSDRLLADDSPDQGGCFGACHAQRGCKAGPMEDKRLPEMARRLLAEDYLSATTPSIASQSALCLRISSVSNRVASDRCDRYRKHRPRHNDATPLESEAAGAAARVHWHPISGAVVQATKRGASLR